MKTLVSDEHALTKPQLDAEPMGLLVSQPGRDPAWFPLAEGKSTVGSSPSCQILLSSTSVRPLQCLIVRKGLEFAVTRWAAGIQLNGVDFTTSPLNVGNVLTIGDLQLQLAGPVVADVEVRAEDTRQESPVDLIDEIEAQVAAEVTEKTSTAVVSAQESHNVATDIAKLRTAKQQTRQRFRRLLGALRELRGEARTLEEQVSGLTEQLNGAQQAHERLATDLYQTQAVATERESQIGEELDRAIAELTASHAEAEATSKEIESLRARNQQVHEHIDSLSAELASLRELCNGHEQERLRLEQQLADRESELTQLREEFHQLQESFQSSVAELDTRNASLQDQLAEVQSERERELAELRQGLEASVAELHEQNENLRNQWDELCADRDRQIAELHGLNESLRNDASTVATERDQRITELEHIRSSLEGELAAVAEERDRRLSELNDLCESLRQDAAAIANDRDYQVAELNSRHDALRTELTEAVAAKDQQIADLTGRCEAIQAELAAVTAERDRELHELRECMEQSTRDLQGEAERLAAQLTEQANERDRAIDELSEVHRLAVKECTEQIDSLQQQLAALTAERDAQVAALQGDLEQARRAVEEAERLIALPDSEKIELENELQSVRGERQKIAEEKHHLLLQLEDAEKRCKLLEIDVRSVNAEWQRSQSTVARLQDELLSAHAHAADLDAKLCDFHTIAEVDRAVDCDAFAGDLAAVRKDLEEREEALAESQAECEQLRGQVSAAETELAVCQANIEVLSQQVSALQSANLEGQAEQARLQDLADERAAQIDALSEAAHATERTHSAELAAREARLGEVNTELEALRHELATNETTAAARLAELADEVSALQEVVTDANSERVQLVAALDDNESRISALTATASECQRSYAAELADRDSRIQALAAELADTRTSLEVAASDRDTQIASLTAALTESKQLLTTEVQSKEALIAEQTEESAKLQNTLNAQLADRDATIASLTAALTESKQLLTAEVQSNAALIAEQTEESAKLQHALNAQLAERDATIAELSIQLESFRENTSNGLGDHRDACDELGLQLLKADEGASTELALRDAQICELTRELHETQDQLADYMAQSERLAELYRQAQTDLTALTSSQASLEPEAVPSPESNEIRAEQFHSAESPTDTAEVDDPRDNDAPRLERALACFAAEPNVDEANTKTVPFQPASFIDRYGHIFDEENEVADSDCVTAAPPADVPADVNDVHADDNAALEAYMANMMRRVRGELSSDAIVPPVPKEPAPETATFSDPVARMSTLTQRVAVSERDETPDSLIDLHELKQSSQKPPLPTNLSAMRELANISARQAIAKHRKRRHFEGALSKLLVSGIAGGTAAYMLLTADDYLSTYFLAGCGVAVVSGYWGVKLLGILLEVIRDGINNEGTPVELEETADALPIDGVSH